MQPRALMLFWERHDTDFIYHYHHQLQGELQDCDNEFLNTIYFSEYAKVFDQMKRVQGNANRL